MCRIIPQPGVRRNYSKLIFIFGYIDSGVSTIKSFLGGARVDVIYGPDSSIPGIVCNDFPGIIYFSFVIVYLYTSIINISMVSRNASLFSRFLYIIEIQYKNILHHE